MKIFKISFIFLQVVAALIVAFIAVLVLYTMEFFSTLHKKIKL
jgi:hypothetical protein